MDHPIPSPIENFPSDKASATDLQQAKLLSKQPMCKHMGDADSCKDGDAGAVKSEVFNRTRYKFIHPSEIEQKVADLKRQGLSIATLNGSFDLLHAGHLEMLSQASKQGDILIVALNTDRSIQTYKSPLRPIIPLEYRLEMMAALEMVDYVTWFDETDPRELLAKIRPHVHVNGAEYGENCIEAETVREHGGRIHIVQLVPGLSTSAIIKKIQSLGSCG